mgnify:FL=1|tara:strand:+ start:20 stop:676 length:657 start_codon:yes stop_codon:yes gene_type:complete
MRGIIFKTVKEGFRRLHKAHKAEVRRAKKTKVPVIPMSLKKADFKKKIRGTKFMTAAEYKAVPKTKSLPRGGRPRIFGKAYASDKRGKGLQINPLSKKDRQKIQDEISESVKIFLKRKKDEPMGYKRGGMKKMLLGGLLTSGIKAAAKKYFKHGRKTSEIVKKEGGTRAEAKSDVKSGIRDELKGKFQDLDKKYKANKSDELIKIKRRFTIRDMKLLK